MYTYIHPKYNESALGSVAGEYLCHMNSCALISTPSSTNLKESLRCLPQSTKKNNMNLTTLWNISEIRTHIHTIYDNFYKHTLSPDATQSYLLGSSIEMIRY